jgi:hypothetical protein
VSSNPNTHDFYSDTSMGRFLLLKSSLGIINSEAYFFFKKQKNLLLTTSLSQQVLAYPNLKHKKVPSSPPKGIQVYIIFPLTAHFSLDFIEKF